jgi:hypothetical protein
MEEYMMAEHIMNNKYKSMHCVIGFMAHLKLVTTRADDVTSQKK